MRALLLAAVLAAGCSKPDPNAEVCDHYARLMVKCADPTENAALLSDTAKNFCKKGMSGKHEQIFGAGYKAMIECTRTAETCAALERCQQH